MAKILKRGKKLFPLALPRANLDKILPGIDLPGTPPPHPGSQYGVARANFLKVKIQILISQSDSIPEQ